MKLWTSFTGIVVIVMMIIGIAQFALPSEVIPTFNLVITSLFAALSAFGSLLTIREMRQERLERSRPFLLVDMELASDHNVYWVVRNIGGGPAINATFKFDLAPPILQGGTLSELPFFQQPVPIMPPGQEIKHLVHSYMELANNGSAMKYKVSVIYDWAGRRGEQEVFTIDLGRWMNSIVPSKTATESLEDISEEIKELRHTINKVESMGRIRIEYHKPRVIRRREQQQVTLNDQLPQTGTDDKEDASQSNKEDT